MITLHDLMIASKIFNALIKSFDVVMRNRVLIGLDQILLMLTLNRFDGIIKLN